MGKRAYEVWGWSRATAKKILEPFQGGSGFAAAFGNFSMNIMVLPFTFLPSLPFFAVARLAKLWFRRENQVVIPIYSPEAHLDPTRIGGQIKRDQIRVAVLPDGLNGFTFPIGKTDEDGWFDRKSLGIQDGLVTWIYEAWDDRRNVCVTYHLMMKGTVPKLDGAVRVPLSELDGMIPEDVLNELSRRPNGFEFWKGVKFDLVYPEGWT